MFLSCLVPYKGYGICPYEPETIERRLRAARILSQADIRCLVWAEDALAFIHAVPTCLFDLHLTVSKSDVHRASNAIITSMPYEVFTPDFEGYCYRERPCFDINQPLIFPHSVHLRRIPSPVDEDDDPETILIHPPVQVSIDLQDSSRSLTLPPFPSNIVFPTHIAFLDSIVDLTLDPPHGRDFAKLTNRIGHWLPYLFTYVLQSPVSEKDDFKRCMEVMGALKPENQPYYEQIIRRFTRGTTGLPDIWRTIDERRAQRKAILEKLGKYEEARRPLPVPSPGPAMFLAAREKKRRSMEFSNQRRLHSLAFCSSPWPFDVTTLSAPDGSITAKFVSLGATMTELWVRDKHGNPRDVILGYDDNTLLLTDPAHPVFNPIVGRYANRIKNGAVAVTLHGGILGWDRRNWTIVSRTPSSVTYKHLDAADEGFPGNVTAYATHTVSNGGVLKTEVYATATQKTPIMLTQHIYWNLDAFQDGSDNILSHHLKIDSSKVIAVDSNAIPTGNFVQVEGTPFNFKNEEKIGARWNDTINLCGSGCQGYDHAWIYDGDESQTIGTSLWSELSGIRRALWVDILTNQPAVQVYTANWLNTPRKVIHGGPTLNYTKWSAVAIEQEGYIDAINTPEWGVDQIFHK
ncbi:hypothetical protein H0H93_004182 [Arthromyces matolae]|nr:hypothetical protein H0H93_004182 [Arthromyces matolae]